MIALRRLPKAITSSQRWSASVILLSAVLLILLAGWDAERRHLARALSIDGLPWSVSGVSCTDYGVTDILVRCAFTVDPDDLPSLAAEAGLTLTEGPTRPRTSCPELKGREANAAFGGPSVGEDFIVATKWASWLDGEPHDGALQLRTDCGHERAQVDLWME